MRNRLFAIAAIAGAMAAPIVAQAQTTITTGTAGGGTVVIGEHEGIVAAQRPAFREYIVRERVPKRRDLLRRAAIVWHDAVSLHGRERPDDTGRTAFASYRSGGRLTSVA